MLSEHLIIITVVALIPAIIAVCNKKNETKVGKLVRFLVVYVMSLMLCIFVITFLNKKPNIPLNVGGDIDKFILPSIKVI